MGGKEKGSSGWLVDLNGGMKPGVKGIILPSYEKSLSSPCALEGPGPRL